MESLHSGPVSYHVFLSFKSSDTRHDFTGHLYSALMRSGLYVFRFEEYVDKGENITSLILNAIEKSRVAILVFSKNYTSSEWCLSDVAKIMECRKSRGQIVLPVYHGIKPADLMIERERYAKGKFPDKVERWGKALVEATRIQGFSLEDYRGPASLIEAIVLRVLSDLEGSPDDMPFLVHSNLVGMDSHLKVMYELLDLNMYDVRMVALCGMGGLGKTTITKIIYNQIARNFKCKGFSANVRETCQDSLVCGLLKLQQGLLSQMMRETVEIWDVDQGANMIKERCRSNRTLLVIDDVDHPDQIDKLAGLCDWYAFGSRIIITTRNASLVNGRKNVQLYHVPELGRHDAEQLFKRTLFLDNDEIKEYEEQVSMVLDYLQGLPLAITVVAANLRGKSKNEWISALRVWKEIPNPKIFDVLRLSYDSLNDLEKETFLDIACFFKGQPLIYVRNVLECCELHPDFVMGVLLSRYLISIKYDRVDMHDMIQEMGREIIRRESTKDPGKRSRVWSQDAILEVLTGDMGTDTIEGIRIEIATREEIEFNANAFKNMRYLRLFIARNALPTGNSINFPRRLRWLEWPEYPFSSLPLHHQNNRQLAGLYMSKSHIILSEDDLKPFHNLKFINFSYCTSLRKIPDISSLSNLESLNVEECTELVEVHQSLGSLEKLVHLNFINCNKLRTFPMTLNSKVLQDLLLKGCLKLSKFPKVLVEMQKLKELTLDGTAIVELPSSIENLIVLEEFYLENCRKLKLIPSSIYRLQKLEKVSFADCSELNEFPENVNRSSGSLPALVYLDLQRCGLEGIDFLKDLSCKTILENLDLSGSKICTVPKCIEEFVALQQLNLENCKQLQDIQGLPPNINYLAAKGCESLEWHVPLSQMLKSQSEESPRFRHIDFSGSCKLTQNLSTSTNFLSIEDLLVDSQIKILYPGSEIPKWFDHQKAEGSLSFLVNTELYQNIAGLAFCVVIGSGGRKIAALSCEIRVYNNNQMAYHFVDIFHSLEMDHMWLVYVPCIMMWGWKTKTQDRCNDVKVLFKLSRGKLKCCGVHLVLKDHGSRERPNFWTH